MYKVHRKLYNKSLKIPLKFVPQSLLNRSRKPSKTTLKKNIQKNANKPKKVPKMVTQRGGPGGTSNVVFGHGGAPGRPWKPQWLPDLHPGHLRPLRTLIFNDFRSILVPFLQDSWHFFVHCRSSFLAHIHHNPYHLSSSTQTTTTHDPQPMCGHSGGDGPQGSWIYIHIYAGPNAR